MKKSHLSKVFLIGNHGVLQGELIMPLTRSILVLNVKLINKQCKGLIAATTFGAIALLLLGGLLANVDQVKANSRTIVVPDDFSTITDALSNASTGDIVKVREGVYYENPLIDKSLSLEGDGAAVIGVGGLERGAKSVFTLAANGVKLSGFTIRSKNYSSATYHASGVNVDGDNCVIRGNIIEGTYYGIFVSVQSSILIANNSITGALKDGIRICGGSKNTVTENIIAQSAQSGLALDGYSDTVTRNIFARNGRGVGVGASYSVVSANNLTDNVESGLYFAASDCIVTQNNISGGKYGIYFTSFFAAPNKNTFYGNNFWGSRQQVNTSSAFNGQFWDGGSQLGGNYWSNYEGSDANGDGKGDLPLRVYESNFDSFPLMKPSTLSQNDLAPALPIPPTTSNKLTGKWLFDSIEPNGITPDALGCNPIMLEPNGNTFNPVLAEGKVGKALSFNGTDYAYVKTSPSLDVHGEFTIDAWVCVKEFKNIAYNNIMVECARTPDRYPTRVMGFAFNGEIVQNSSSLPQGALRGFLLDEDGVFNEIVTTQATLPLNEWVHAVFIRSFRDGMHIYVNEVEQAVQVTSGNRNPDGDIAKGTEFYVGHDSISTIDEVSISLAALEQVSPESNFWSNWWIVVGLCLVVIFLAVGLCLLKRNRALP
jgi:parallel beta-helix repeat protein